MGAVVLFVCLDAPATVKTYFRLERAWSEHWPVRGQRGIFEALEPRMRGIGVLRPARVEVEPGISFFLDPRDMVPVNILRSGQWQPEIWDSLSSSLGQGSVFLDVGAHIGYFSIKAARRVGGAGRVVSFEPNPETLKLLRDNIAANNTSNVIVEPIACTDRDQTLTIYAAGATNTGASSLSRDNAQISPAAPKAYQVRGRPIDDVVRELGLSRVDAIKIDVEGAEVLVLRGALETLRRFHPKVVTEVSPRQLASFQTTPDQLVSLIQSAGYNLGKPLNPQEADWEWTVAGQANLASTVRVNDPATSGQFIRGIRPGEGVARWTDPRFTVALRSPPGSDKNGAWLSLNLYVAEASINSLKQLTLSAVVNGTVLPPQTFTAAGRYDYRRELPASTLSKSMVEADFSLDRFLKMDGYNLGVIITSVGLEAK